MYVKYCVLLSVDTCPGHPGGDRPCGRGTPLPGRAMDLPCHRGKGFNSNCLLQLSNTSNIMLSCMGSFAGERELTRPRRRRRRCCSLPVAPFSNSIKMTQSDILCENMSCAAIQARNESRAAAAKLEQAAERTREKKRRGPSHEQNQRGARFFSWPGPAQEGRGTSSVPCLAAGCGPQGRGRFQIFICGLVRWGTRKSQFILLVHPVS